MMAKMENLGCEKSVVGLVIPTGYSFNLDGTCIYLTMAALFLAQATNTDLTLEPAAGHRRHPAADLEGRRRRHRLGLHRARRDAGRVGTMPVAGIALMLGVDRFMSEARALTNLIGNGVATIVVSKWENALDEERMHTHLERETDAEADEPEAVLVEHEIEAVPAARPLGA